MEDGIFDSPTPQFHQDSNTSFLMEDDLLTFETDAIGFTDPHEENRFSFAPDNINTRSDIKTPTHSILDHDGPINKKSIDASANLPTSFTPLTSISEEKIHSKMENWDQDVLLSNASLPEMNPLLDLGDDSVEDDFQRMLSDWESHIDTLQTNDTTNAMETQILNTLDDSRSNAAKMQNTNNLKGSEDVNNETHSTSNETFPNLSSRVYSDKFTVGNHSDNETKNIIHPDKKETWPMTQASSDISFDSNMIPSSPLSKALALASQSPISDINDDYFESLSQSPKSYAKKNGADTQYPMHNNSNNEIKLQERSVRMYRNDQSSISKDTLSAKEDSDQLITSNGVDSKVDNNLAGIVISSGPNGHFETFEVLEASDAENLLDKFEDASNQANDSKMGELSNESKPRSPGRLTFSKSSQDPQKKSQIIAAVQNHFSISSSNDTTPNTIDTNSIGKRPPRIVPSQRIKDALPREIIEKIKASSQRSRTIAIIEPAVNSPSQKGGNGTTNSNMIKLNGQFNSPLKDQSVSSGTRFTGNVNSYTRSSNTLLSKNTGPSTTSNINTSSVWTTRFQDAATNLNRNRQYRHLSSTSTPSNIVIGGKAPSNVSVSSSVVLPHQQAPNQVSLDHDYCSPANKVRRQRNMSSTTLNHQQVKIVGNVSNTKMYTYVNDPASASNTKIEVMKRLSGGISSNTSMHTSPQIIRKRAVITTTTDPLSRGEHSKSPIIVPSSQVTPSATSGSTIPLSIRSRPYVRVSTGNKVVTANLLKPTPLSSASMRQRTEVVTASVASTSNQTASLTLSNESPRVLQMESLNNRVPSRSNSAMVSQQIIEYPSLSPQNSPPAAGISLVNTTNRRDSDHKKDSGLESGEVSDDSHDGQINANREDTEGYSKLPSYLTTINVANCSDSRTVSAMDETGCYDRLPAYITGVGSRGSSVERIVKTSVPEHNIHTAYNGIPDSSSREGNGPCAGEGSSVRPSPKGKKSLKHYRRKNVDSDSSRSRSRSPIGISTRLRGSPKLPGSSDIIVKSSSSDRPRRRSRSRSSSSSSSYLSSRCSSPDSSSSTPSPIKEAKKRSRRRSWRKSSRYASRSSPDRSSSKRKNPGSSRNKSLSHRSTSPKRMGNSSRNNRYGKEENSNGSNRRFTRDRQRREQEERHNDQENSRQVEERRVVFVGKISENTTRADLRKRFEVFGPIVEISVHFRDRGDNYGFVTFKYKVDAYEAIEHGNDDPSFPTVDICFGGRRTFCKEKYSDLDSAPIPDLDLNPRLSSRHFSMDEDVDGPSLNDKRAVTDFDALLQQAKAGINKNSANERSKRHQK